MIKVINKAAKELSGGDPKLEEGLRNNLENLFKARTDIFQHTTPPRGYKFKSGDMVYSTKTKDFGFIVGPIDPWCPDIDNVSYSKYKRYLMVAINRDHAAFQWIHKQLDPLPDDEYKNTLGNGYFCVRFPRQQDLQLFIPEEEEPLLGEPVDDISRFCTDQCMFECNKDCFLYKYGKSKEYKK